MLPQGSAPSAGAPSARHSLSGVLPQCGAPSAECSLSRCSLRVVLLQQNALSGWCSLSRYSFNEVLPQGSAPSAGYSLRAMLPQQGLPRQGMFLSWSTCADSPVGCSSHIQATGCAANGATHVDDLLGSLTLEVQPWGLWADPDTRSQRILSVMWVDPYPPLPGLAPGTCWRQPTSWGSPGPLCHLPNPACLPWAFPRPCVPGQLWPGHPQTCTLVIDPCLVATPYPCHPI